MAAIFGILGPATQDELEAMAARLAHRGGHPQYLELDGVSLGLLANHPGQGIIQDNRFALAANAQIFNETALCASLDQQPTSTDALILACYAGQGLNAMAALNGEFALALWDGEQRQLILSRDYVGTRPLFYTHLPSKRLAFASEYKALLALPELSVEVDREMLQFLQHYKQVPSHRTLLKDIHGLPPGSALVFNEGARQMREQRFPTVALRVEPLALADASQRVADTLLEVLEARIDDRPRLGIALSGGIDSMGLACACRRLRPDTEIHAFTAGHGPEDPEILTAAFVAEKIGAVHHRVIVTPETLVERLPRVVWHLEDPIARSESVQFYELGQAAGQYVDFLFSGAAADGIFAGMPRHKILYLMQLLPFLRHPLAEFYTLTQSGRPPRSPLGKLLDRLYFKGRLPGVPRVLGSNFEPPLVEFPRFSAEFINEVLCATLQEAVARWLAKEERTLRAGGVDNTLPFLDRRMIEVGFSIPSALKIRRGKEKYVLRQALRSLVPAEVLNRPKFPMRMKYDASFADNLDAMAHRYLSRERVEARGFFDWQDLQRLFQRPQSGVYSAEGAMRLWTALATEIWAEHFLDRRGAAPTAS